VLPWWQAVDVCQIRRPSIATAADDTLADRLGHDCVIARAVDDLPVAGKSARSAISAYPSSVLAKSPRHGTCYMSGDVREFHVLDDCYY
jgi:hypothetical protein